MTGKPPPRRRNYFALAALVTVLDQASKAIISAKVPLHTTVTVVPQFFSLSHVLNRGAAFSLFSNLPAEYTRPALIAFSATVFAAVVWALARLPHLRRLLAPSLALILGGAAGNLIDRLRLGSVVDFLAFDLGRYHWPDFNLADSAIVLGAFLLIVDSLWPAPKD